MTVVRSRHAAAVSRTGRILATSGSLALVMAAVLTAQPRAGAMEPPATVAGAAGTATRATVHVLTPRVEAGGTARIIVGVAADGVRPDGDVRLEVGDRELTRALVAGTASASVRLDDPGTVRVRARHVDGDAASWSAPVEITVHQESAE